MAEGALGMKTRQSLHSRRAFYIKVLILVVPFVVFLATPPVPFTPIRKVTAAFLLYIVFAIGATENVRQAFASDAFWVSLTRKRGILIGVISGCFLLIHIALGSLQWEIGYSMWYDARLPLGAILFTSAVILGVMAGRDYSAAQYHAEDQAPAVHRTADALPSSWLYAHSGEPKRLWFWLAIIGFLPTLITLIIVIEGCLDQGLFYAGLDHSYIDSVEWTSDHEITFRLVGFYITDCVGCGYGHSLYTVDLATQEVKLMKSEYFSWQGFPETRLFDHNVLSPDHSRLAYVANHYDLYVKQLNGGLFSIHRVYRYSGLNFFGRHFEALVHSLLISLLVGIALVFPYFYANRKRTGALRGFTAMVIWNLLLFAGSIMSSDFALFSINSYLWKPIP